MVPKYSVNIATFAMGAGDRQTVENGNPIIVYGIQISNVNAGGGDIVRFDDADGNLLFTIKPNFGSTIEIDPTWLADKGLSIADGGSNLQNVTIYYSVSG